MTDPDSSAAIIWKQKPLWWVAIAGACIIAGIINYDGLVSMEDMWSRSEEYGYGYIIPLISLFLIWQHKDELEQIEFAGSYTGILVILFALLMTFVGKLGSVFTLIQYSFVLLLAGIALSVTGWRGMKIVWVPFLLLFFMIPLPAFLYSNLSNQLQLISSELGVWFIRLFDISVYLEGNVIDLGNYKLQVVEACSGLRYLFPLASLSFIAAYFFKGSVWKKLVIFISCIPITIFMNSFRIGVIGILVEFGGNEQAKGFLHYFEGWVIFMACMAILVMEMWVLANIPRRGHRLSDVFALEIPEKTPEDAQVVYRSIPRSFIVASAILIISLVVFSGFEVRKEITPERVTFNTFPSQIEGWEGNPDKLESVFIDALKFDDYILAEYRNKENENVNFYIAYYASQHAGQSAHSPRSCLPGGGWVIEALSQNVIDGVFVNNKPLLVNRVLIKKGDYTQLVYYWFQQRGRIITNEYMVKWYLFWDALTRNRTDGALVRLTALIGPGEDVADADARLTSFAKDVAPVLDDYIPD